MLEGLDAMPTLVHAQVVGGALSLPLGWTSLKTRLR